MRIILALLFCICFFSVKAQYVFPDKALCEQIANRTLAVELLNETDQSAKNLNQAIKDVFNEYWKFSPIEYITIKRRTEIMNKKDTKYIVLMQREDSRVDKRHGTIDANGVRHFGNQGNIPFSYTVFEFAFYNFRLLMPTNKKPEVITEIGFPNSDLAKIDYIFLVQQLNRLISNSLSGTPMDEFYNIDRNMEKCRNSTLVILKDFIKPKELDEIEKNYEYKYELVDYSGYEDIIIKMKPGNVYTKIIWSNQHQIYMWVVVDPVDGSILSQMGFGGIKFGPKHTANEIIKASHFKQIYNKTGQKFNNKYD